MFSLIITIISIALVAALALATLYYGGSAFNKGSAGATAAKFINEGQQINGAVQLARADSASGDAAGATAVATTLAALSPVYMAQLPAGWDATVVTSTGVAKTSAVVSTDVCTEVNKRAGNLTAVTPASTVVFGCDVTVPATPVVFYKF
ncbi:MAG: hypothetical protein Q7S87_08700 [Agitococcus sp.]|nr:hypothetical protein [Agitococcus sp.]MDO9176976.1 hypothetical protein [Agitococcus sp.]